jgi:two-component system sensor histidine kinase KdpD
VLATGTSMTGDGWLGVPLICLGETIGVLEVDGPSGRPFGDDDVRLLEGLAVQVAGSIESARRFRHVMELERLKSDFISRVSHELRTPITIIDGFISTMIDHAEHLDPEQRRHMLSRSKAAVGRLSRLIEDLITLSRLETGVVMAHPVTVRLAELLDQVQLGSETPDRVAVRCPDDLHVTTDPALLTRAVGFVVDNALKYGDTADVVVTSPATAPAPVVVTITDRGPGIPEDVRSTVFELFTRSASTTTVPGLGLGLAMARTLLDVLGATIDVSSEPGRGTSVSINIPA